MRTLPRLLLLLIMPVFALGLQESQIRVDVEAVNILVTVTDDKGRFVTDLSRNRFSVFENGDPQEISNFSQETELPLLIGLLIDTSASVRLKLDFEKEAARNFIYSVMRREDQALLIEFDQGITMLHDFTSRPGAIVREIERLRAGGGTALIDAIYLVARDKMTTPNTRKTMVLVSDGHDLNSKRNLEEAITMAQRSGVIIYAIGTSRFGATPNRKGEKTLKELAEETGGRAFFPYSTERLESAFDLVNQELRSQYSLTYVPSNTRRDGKFRKVEIKLKDDKDLNVRHREGYFAPKEAESSS